MHQIISKFLPSHICEDNLFRHHHQPDRQTDSDPETEVRPLSLTEECVVQGRGGQGLRGGRGVWVSATDGYIMGTPHAHSDDVKGAMI